MGGSSKSRGGGRRLLCWDGVCQPSTSLLGGSPGGETPQKPEELQRFDRSRKDKKVSNEEWTSPTDGDARIAKMQDSRTHLADKAEHVADLESESCWRRRCITPTRETPTRCCRA